MESKVLDSIVLSLITIKEDKNCYITDDDIKGTIEVHMQELVEEIRKEMEEI